MSVKRNKGKVEKTGTTTLLFLVLNTILPLPFFFFLLKFLALISSPTSVYLPYTIVFILYYLLKVCETASNQNGLGQVL